MSEIGSSAVGWILQLKEIIALVAVLLYGWHLQSKHIPFLLMREAERAKNEGDRFQIMLSALEERHQSNHASIERLLEKLNDTLADGLQHLKDVLVSHYQHTEGERHLTVAEKSPMVRREK